MGDRQVRFRSFQLSEDGAMFFDRNREGEIGKSGSESRDSSR